MTKSKSLQRPNYLLLFSLLCGAIVVAASDRIALAQPGDIARSFAAEMGMVGEMGEPNHGPGFADGIKCRVRPQDEVWVISSRHLGWPSEESSPPPLKYWRWSCDKKQWRKLSADKFFETDSAAAVTFIYVHGNRIDSWQAVDLGWYTYNSIVRASDDAIPVRYVIYSWPSTRICGSQMNDLRYKANRTNAEAYYLGWVVDNIRADVSVSVMGFSYGARVITGAMHLAAGGTLCGQSLPGEQPLRRHNIRVVLMAGALHNFWMWPGCFHGQALEATDKMLILANSCDKVLQRYHWLFKGEKPQALGVTGLSWFDRTGRVAELDCCCCVGETHDSLMYLNAPNLAELMQNYVLWRDVKQQLRQARSTASRH